MVRSSRVAPCLFILALSISLLSMGLEAGNPSDFDQIFQNIDRQNLNSRQRIAIRAMRNRLKEEQILKPGISSQESQHFVNEFLLCASGVLDDSQFQSATGIRKNARQKLRYEIRQLHSEIVRLEGLIRQLNR